MISNSVFIDKGAKDIHNTNKGLNNFDLSDFNAGEDEYEMVNLNGDFRSETEP